eukprot:m.748663 g.748663  ORF g.748663 m.748663 type:complete len:87 (-) comp23148_c0_seq75:2375-2635(-)
MVGDGVSGGVHHVEKKKIATSCKRNTVHPQRRSAMSNANVTVPHGFSRDPCRTHGVGATRSTSQIVRGQRCTDTNHIAHTLGVGSN